MLLNNLQIIKSIVRIESFGEISLFTFSYNNGIYVLLACLLKWFMKLWRIIFFKKHFKVQEYNSHHIGHVYFCEVLHFWPWGHIRVLRKWSSYQMATLEDIINCKHTLSRMAGLQIGAGLYTCLVFYTSLVSNTVVCCYQFTLDRANW